MSPPQPPNPPQPAPQPAPENGWSKLGMFVLGIMATVAVGGLGLYYVLKPSAPTPEPVVISIDPTTPPHVGRIVNIHAETAGGLVKWKMLTAPTDKWDIRYVGALQHDIYFAATVAGDYRLECLTVVGNEADEAEIHVLVDVGPTPIPPGPGPTPTPIPAGQLRILMTYDPNVSVSAGQLAVLKSAATQKLVPSGNWRIFPTDETFGDELPLWKDVFGKRKNKVGVVIFSAVDGSIAYEGDLPGSMADAAALVKKYGG